MRPGAVVNNPGKMKGRGAATPAVDWRRCRAWQIGKRASNLATLSDFKGSIRRRGDEIGLLSAFRFGDSDLPVERVAAQVLSLIESLGIVDNEAKLVAGTKTLHHLLPDLVVPMDRRYTGTFLGCAQEQFQNQWRELFLVGFNAFHIVASSGHPASYVGKHPWHTSVTKVIDNAIVGFGWNQESNMRVSRSQGDGASGTKAPSAEDFRKELRQQVATAQAAGAAYVDIHAGQLHRAVGGYPSPKTQRLPVCCAVMRKEMKENDEILQQPPKGAGANLIVRFHLPR
jgi:hypothetical protein